jgi:serine/threonine protein kinase
VNPAATQREYHLLRCLGRGGFGEVYLARIRSAEGQFELDAAVKLLHGRLSPDSDAVARLRDEGRLLALVDHPAILGVRDLLVFRMDLDGPYGREDREAAMHPPRHSHPPADPER